MAKQKKQKIEERQEQKGTKEKIKVFGIIKDGFNTFLKNIIIILPFLFKYILTFALIIPFVIWLSLLWPADLSFADFESQCASNITNIFSFLPPIFFIFAFTTFLVIVFFSCFFSAGALGMVAEACKNTKITLKEITKYGKKFWLRYLGIMTIIGVIGIIILAIISIPLAFIPAYLEVFSNIIALFISFLAILFFLLAPSLLVLKNYSIIEAIKRSFSLVRKNYWQFFLISLIFILMLFAFSFTPFIGSVISLLIILPIQMITYMLIAILLEKKYI